MDRTWQTSIDVVPQDQTTLVTQAKSALWLWVETLIGTVGGFTQGLWTCYYSCDSVTAGTANDGVDRWGGATYNAAKIVRAAAGSAHSWFVLKSPATMGRLGNETFYMIIDWSPGQDYQINVWMSKAAPTGGSTTACPTATDQIQVATQIQFLPSTTVGLWRWTMQLSTAGDWWIGGAVNSVGLMQTFLGFFSLMAPPGGFGADQWAAVFYTAVQTNSPGTPLYSGNVVSRNYLNSVAGNSTIMTLYAFTIGAVVPSSMAVGGDGLTNASFRFPIYIYDNTSKHLRGRLPDIMHGIRAQSPGLSTGGDPKVILGDFWLPLPQVPLL